MEAPSSNSRSIRSLPRHCHMSSTYTNHIHAYLIAVPGIDSTQVACKKDKCKHSYLVRPCVRPTRQSLRGNRTKTGTATAGYGFQDMVFRTWDLNFGARTWFSGLGKFN